MLPAAQRPPTNAVANPERIGLVWDPKSSAVDRTPTSLSSTWSRAQASVLGSRVSNQVDRGRLEEQTPLNLVPISIRSHVVHEMKFTQDPDFWEYPHLVLVGVDCVVHNRPCNTPGVEWNAHFPRTVPEYLFRSSDVNMLRQLKHGIGQSIEGCGCVRRLFYR
jgi:hypothetical protein